jgi:hypothetical protein
LFFPLPLIPSHERRGDSLGYFQNVRRKFSDSTCKNSIGGISVVGAWSRDYYQSYLKI